MTATPKPLSPAQQAALGALVATGRLRSVPMDVERALSFLAQAAEARDSLSPAKEAAAAYNNLRSIRNGLRYRAKVPSRAETGTATAVAQTLLEGSQGRFS